MLIPEELARLGVSVQFLEGLAHGEDPQATLPVQMRGLIAEQVAARLDDLDVDGRRRLLRLVVEKIRVTGWRAEIHVKILLPDDPPDDNHEPTEPQPDGLAVKRYAPAFPS